jgi:branched-chain amino acid transport system ATP-binding protein
MTAPTLSLERITKRFGGVTALDGIDFRVDAGEILGLVGPNGAGKSVLVNVITGFYEATSGVISLGGLDISAHPAHLRARLGIARTFQNIRLFRRMTVLENVMVAFKDHAKQPLRSLFATGMSAHVETAMSLLDRMGLAGKADSTADGLAYGEARRLEIARALAGKPSLLLLDEPAAGMNDRETEELGAHIAALRASVSAIVVIEHDMGFLRDICNRMVVLDYGKKIADGSVDVVLRDERVIESYLGVDE